MVLNFPRQLPRACNEGPSMTEIAKARPWGLVNWTGGSDATRPLDHREPAGRSGEAEYSFPSCLIAIVRALPGSAPR